MADIFLSYSRTDSALMQRLRNDFQQAGLTVWTDQGLEPGTPSWQRAVEEAIEAARCAVVILSPDAKQSKWVEIEVSYAEDIGLRIFPVLARGDERTAVLFRLRATQRVDIRDNYQNVPARLVPALQRYLQPVEKQRFPIEFDWVTIPAGEFSMGSDKQKDSQARDNELPQHQVYLPEYRIARVPVTNAQYKLFVEATGHRPPKHWQNGAIPQGKESHPVVTVTWHDAQVFCRWAGVRLPTEAEWEKAARGPDGRIWPWGNEEPTEERCNFAWKVGDTTPVGTYPKGASPYDVLDMAGNVWEWTSSLFRQYPYRTDDGREDLEGASIHLLRGGSFANNDYNVRCAYRGGSLPVNVIVYFGFRVVVGSSPGS